MHIEIIDPKGKRVEATIEEKSANIFAIRCVPQEIGDHQILFYRDKEKTVRMTKFICQVYDANKILVSDLPSAVAHRPYTFTSRRTSASFALPNPLSLL